MTSRVLVSLRVAAAPERAFRVFVEEIGAWWQPDTLFPTTPRPPGVLAFEPGPEGRLIETLEGGKVFEVGRITLWQPWSRLVFTWRPASFRPEQTTEVNVRFEPIGAETRVTVEHLGWDTVPQDHVARHGFPDHVFLLRAGEWWQAELCCFGARIK